MPPVPAGRGAEPRHLAGRTAHRQPIAQPVGVDRRQRRARDPRASRPLAEFGAAPRSALPRPLRSQVEQPGRVVDHDPGPPAIAAHRARILVPRVRHDLFVQRAVQRRLGDHPGAQTVWRQPLALGHGELRRRRPGPQDLVDSVSGQPPLDACRRR